MAVSAPQKSFQRSTITVALGKAIGLMSAPRPRSTSAACMTMAVTRGSTPSEQ